MDLLHADLGGAGVAYEMLGSDGGDHQFVTTLATTHEFNGWADAFADDGGPRGLLDLQLHVSPRLPLGFEGRLVYHQFFRADGGQDLGSELDGAISRGFNAYPSGLVGFGWLEATDRGPADRWRAWAMVDFRYRAPSGRAAA